MGRLYEILTSPSLPAVLCNFMRGCSHVGIIKTMGIYLEDINICLGTTSTDIGVALGLLSAFSNFPAPIIAALYQRPSIRRLLLIVGACLPATGLVLTAMATSNAQMSIYLSFTGLGICTLMVCCTMTLHHVSSENYNLLFSLSLTGYGVGMVLLPFLAEVLRQAYGWRGGLLIIGALIAHTIPAAVAIKSNSEDTSRQINGFQSIPSSPPEFSDEDERNCRISQDTTGDNSDQIGVIRRITNYLRQSDFYVDPVINIALGATFLFYMVYSGWHSFLVPHALQRGISVQNTIIMTLSAAIGNTVSRATVGVLSNHFFHPVNLYVCATILNITAVLCDVFFSNFYVMLVTSCISAMGIGGRAVLDSLVIRERASPAKFHVAFAANKFFAGLGMFVGGYLSGMIADRFSSYDATFKLLAAFDILVLLLMMVLKCNPKPSAS